MVHKINMENSKKLSFFSVISTFIIVYYHSKSFLFYFNTDLLNYRYQTVQLIEFIASMAMSYFFMISGYLFFHNLDDNYHEKLISRIKSLGIPFLTWNILYLLYYLIVDCILHRKTIELTLKNIILGFTFVPYDGPLWYMFAIVMLFFLCRKLPLIKKQTCKIYYLVIFGINVFLYYVTGKLELKYDVFIFWWLNRLLGYIPAFSVGCIIGIHNPDVIEFKIDLKSKKFLLLLVPIVLFYFSYFTKSVFIMRIAATVSLIIIWVLVPSKHFKDLKLNSIPKFMIYASHMALIDVIGYIFERIFSESLTVSSFISILIPVSFIFIIYIICSVVSFMLKKYLPTFANILTGGRT